MSQNSVSRLLVKFIDLGLDGVGCECLARLPRRLSPKLWWQPRAESRQRQWPPPQFRRESKRRPALIFPTAVAKLPFSSRPKTFSQTSQKLGILSPKLWQLESRFTAVPREQALHRRPALRLMSSKFLSTAVTEIPMFGHQTENHTENLSKTLVAGKQGRQGFLSAALS